MRTDVEVVVGHNFARVGSSRSVVGPCIACSLRSRVAPAPEILCFASLSIVMKQEPQAGNFHPSRCKFCARGNAMKQGRLARQWRTERL